jgi:hypothetical protein
MISLIIHGCIFIAHPVKCAWLLNSTWSKVCITRRLTWLIKPAMVATSKAAFLLLLGPKTKQMAQPIRVTIQSPKQPCLATSHAAAIPGARRRRPWCRRPAPSTCSALCRWLARRPALPFSDLRHRPALPCSAAAARPDGRGRGTPSSSIKKSLANTVGQTL